MAKNKLDNRGFSILNADRLTTEETPTVISVGVARSGTSMIAGTMSALGIYMGDNSNDVVFEDVTIAKALENGDLREIRAIIEAYNARGDIWGFKRPEIYTRLEQYLPLFRNPRVVAIFRDPVAIAKRNEVSMHIDFMTSLEQSIRKTQDLFDVVRGLPVPVMLVSYEKAMLRPGRFVHAFSEFCGIACDAEMRARVVADIRNGSEKYLANTSVRYEGVFAGVAGGVATGWAKRMPRSRVCTVEIVSGGRVVGTGRADLQGEGQAAGRMARWFRIPLDAPVDADDIEARVAGTTHMLKKPPRFSIG